MKLSKSSSNGRPSTILVAEDQPIARQVLAQILTTGGYRVVAFDNGHDAWECIQREAPDLVISDIHMPKINGLDLCQYVRTHKESELIPIILVTGADDIKSRINAFEAGADDILPKPVINEELLARVRNLLRFKDLVRREIENERERARLEKELSNIAWKRQQEQLRNALYHDVLFAATGGRLLLLKRNKMKSLLANWTPVETHVFTQLSEISQARNLAEQMATEQMFTQEVAADVALCVSEAVTNGLKFGDRVDFQIGIFEGELRLLICDNGPGLDRELLPKVALQKGYSSGASMGMGFSLMLELMDQVHLASDDQGTMILLCKKHALIDDELENLLDRFSVNF